MPPKPFRLQSTDLFLTYPQCTKTPDELHRDLRTLLKDFAFAAICREQHATGDPHLHAVVHLSKRCDFSSANCLDIPDGPQRVFHGNYQSARSARHCLEYISKDGDVSGYGKALDAIRVYYNGELGGTTRKRKLGDCVDMIMKGGSFTSLFTDPELSHMSILHQDKIMKAVYRMKEEAMLKLTKKFVKLEPIGLLPEAVAIADWVNANVLKERPFAQKQLYVFGPTRHGKTSLVQQLKTCLRIYTVPDENFYDDYGDEKYDLIVFDEFTTQKTIQWMNRFLDGQDAPLRQKGHQTMKRKNLPVLILSNTSLEGLYCRVEDAHLDTLIRRLMIVHLSEPVRFDLVYEDV